MRLRCALRACIGFALVFPVGFALARAEPTYLITKPFEPETVIATIGQALLMHRDVDMNSKAA